MEKTLFRRTVPPAAILLLASFSWNSVILGQSSVIPTPESVLGFQVGADFEMATYEESIAYFKRLDAATDMLQLVDVGRTSEGRPFYLALISSAENLADVERYRKISLRLAHPYDLTDEEAGQLAMEGRAIVHIDGAVHASEVASHQHTIQLAYDLLSSKDDDEIEAILENVIFMLWPTLNPDGQTMVVEWYESNLGTPYETSSMPQLYQKYVGHDNNRDSYMLNMIESRVIGRTWRYWEPQIIYVHHQTAPFPSRIWLPPFDDPVGNRVHPLMARTVNTIGMLMAQALEERGQVGATHMAPFDAWYPGYIDYLPMLQNVAAFWTETALFRYATPRFYSPSELPGGSSGQQPESLYSSPWPGGWWRLRDAVEYMVTASTAVLDFAAKYKFDLLYNRYQAGRDAIRKYSEEPPYAYFILQDQRDPVAPVELLRRLAFNGIRVCQLGSEVVSEGIRYPAGTWVIPMNQEYGELARTLMEVQVYPDLREYSGGPPKRPYDVSGWTLPYQFDVRVVEASEPLNDDVLNSMRVVEGEGLDWMSARGGKGDPGIDVSPFDSVPGPGFDTDTVAAGILPPAGRLTGSGSAVSVDASQNNAFRAVNIAWREGGAVRFVPGEADETEPGSEGRFIITGLNRQMVDEMVESLQLRAELTQTSGLVMTKPRIGLYRPWSPSMDEGWTRWLLEQYDFDFSSIRNSNLRSGDLREYYDVIIFADFGSRTIMNGYGKGSVPVQYEGGIGQEGIRALDAFIRSGGTLVCMNGSSRFAIDELNLPVKDVTRGLARDAFSAGGSILEVTVDPAHPVMAGMPSKAKIFFSQSPVFNTTEGFTGTALAKYQQSGSPLLSGFLLGEEHLNGYAAALDVKHGNGHVVLIGFKPQWRGQPFGTFRVLFNSALFQGPHATGVGGTPGFWSALPDTT